MKVSVFEELYLSKKLSRANFRNVIVIVCFTIWPINCVESLTKSNLFLVMNI